MSHPPPAIDLGRGEPWVFLHSFPVDHRMWSAQAAALSSAGHRAIACDLPGFGAAPRLASSPPTIDGYADAVLATLDALTLDRVTLVGLSLGGYVALRLADRAPHRLRGLVLADTRAADDSPTTRASRVLNLALVRTKGTAALIEKMLPHVFSPAAAPSLRDTLRGWGAEQSAEAVGDALLAMRDRADASAVLGRLACPTLFIVGAGDTITPPADHAAMAAAVSGARIVEIPNAGHLSNLEQPAAFNAALLDWARS